MSDRVHLLVSPEAGRGRAEGAHASVVATLRSEGVDPVDLTGADASGSLAAVRRAVDGGAERLVVVGGDGLVHLALQAVAASDTVLGVVPVGTGNDFVRGIDGFPTDTQAAARAALGDPTPLDAIRTNHGGWVASAATAGFSGDVNARANRIRRPKGPSRYTVATILELSRLRRRDIRLVVDGAIHEYRSVLVAVGNTGWFGGGMHVCPDADPTDGLLDVTVVGDIGRIELVRFFRRVFDGTHMGHSEVTGHQGAEVYIESEGLALWGDGEPIGVAPVTFRATPGAIRLAR